MSLLLILSGMFLSTDSASPQSEDLYPHEESVVKFDQFVLDLQIRKEIFRIYDLIVTKTMLQDKALTVKGTDGRADRKFKIVEVFEIVTRKGNIYSVQIHADEIGAKSGYLLLFNVQEKDGEFAFQDIQAAGRYQGGTRPAKKR